MNDTVSMKTPTTLPHFAHRYRVIVLFVDNIDNMRITLEGLVVLGKV